MPTPRDYFRAHARRRVNLGATLRDNIGRLARDVRVRDLGLGGACLEFPDLFGLPAASVGGGGGPGGAGGPAGAVPGTSGPSSLSGGGLMSSGGAPMSGTRWLDPDAFVIVELAAPTRWDPLTLQGKVVWIRRASPGRPTRAGIRFEHRDTASLFALFQLLGATAYDL